MSFMFKITEPKERLYCEKCGKLVSYTITEKDEIFKIKKDEIRIKSTIAVCEKCGEELFEPYYENENLKKAYKIYAKKHNLVLPEEIKKIREMYGVSQTLFALILGLGEATIQRYERGSLPTKANSDLIKRAADPIEFNNILENNKDNLSVTDYQRVKNKLSNILKQYEEEFELRKLEEILLSNHESLVIEKLEGLISAIFYYLRKIYGYTYLYKTAFFKMLWFIEKEAKVRFGKQIANLSFIHYYYGPIPKGAKNDEGIFLNYLNKKKLIDINVEFSSDFLNETYKINSKDETAIKYLTNEEKEIVEEIIKKYANLSAKKLSEITHEDEKYINTDHDEEIIL
ncbi:putative zinc finger/helix-turn-helix protein, YgiT family [Marinitoga piezophila KA3]|uniref:Putative zinc finger/helix-turn-helix protein, YgiT family n=2 Tax=Marinitoga TaxID=160798 RepID=H2J440_MARPK|nr:putative zinc finger/helix-turn-helix protein, YgiT family [Marinitoga piezophila KA3]